MHLIIIGAGRTGKHVIASAIADGHEVVVIENDTEVAQKAATNFDCLVINADACSFDSLKEADAENTDAMIATTSDDAVNLLAMMLGRDLGIKKLVSSVTNVDHIKLFKQLGVNIVENPFRLNGQFLYRAVQKSSVKDFMDLGDGVEVIEFIVSEKARAISKPIRELSGAGILPKESRIIAIKREEKLIIPHGSTIIEKGDVALVLTQHGLLKQLLEVFADED